MATAAAACRILKANCLLIWRLEPVDPPCAMPFPSSLPSLPPVFDFVFDDRQIVSTTYINTHTDTDFALYPTSTRTRDKRDEVRTLRRCFSLSLSSSWRPCGVSFCCLLLCEKATSLCLCSWPTIWPCMATESCVSHTWGEHTLVSRRRAWGLSS